MCENCFGLLGKSGAHGTSQVPSGNDDLYKKLGTETLFLRLVRQMKVKRVYGGRGLERGRLARTDERTNERRARHRRRSEVTIRRIF